MPDEAVRSLPAALGVLDRVEAAVGALLERASGAGVTAGLALKHQAIQLFRHAFTVALPRPQPRARLSSGLGEDVVTVADSPEQFPLTLPGQGEAPSCIWASGQLTKQQQLKVLAQLTHSLLVYGTVGFVRFILFFFCLVGGVMSVWLGGF